MRESRNAQLWDNGCRSYAVIGETPNFQRLRTGSNDAVMEHGWMGLGLGTISFLFIGCRPMALMFFATPSS
jgi:hypothetical protein